MTKSDNSSLGERKRGSGAKLVYDLLRHEILDLALPPGGPVATTWRMRQIPTNRSFR